MHFLIFKSLSCNKKIQLVCFSHPSSIVVQTRNSHEMGSSKYKKKYIVPSPITYLTYQIDECV